MRVGVIGLGSIGTRHATNIQALGHDVYGFDPQVPQRDGVMLAGSVQGVAAFEPDAILICTPAATHASVARDLLAYGYDGPLFVEKPLALTVEEAAVFRDWPHPVTQVGYMFRFHPKMQSIREAVPHPIGGGFYCDCDARTWPGAGYGPMLLECSHELDLALWCGAPETVVAASSRASAHAADLWLGDEERWLFSYDAESESYVRQWMLSDNTPRFDGDGGRVRFDSPDEQGNDALYLAEIRDFLFCVEMTQTTRCPFSDGLRVLRVCDQAAALVRVNA